MSFDPIAEGQKTAKENAKSDRQATEQTGEAIGQNLGDAQKLAKKNAKLDDSRRGEAKMEPQDVGTSERDIPEGAPVTDTPEVSHTDESKASSKDADVKKDLPDNKKRQDTDKDSATPSPSTDDSSEEAPEVSTELSLKELQEIAKNEEVEGEFTKPGTSKQSVVDAILAKRGESTDQ